MRDKRGEATPLAPSQGREIRWAVLLPLLFLALWSLLAEPGWAQKGLRVLSNQASAQFPLQITFHIQADSINDFENVILHYGTNGQSCLSSHARQRLDFEPASFVDLHWEWDLKRSGALPPQAEVWWQWEIEDSTGETHWTDRQTLIYEDARDKWRSIARGPITLYWFEGDQAFGQHLVDIAASGLERLESFTGVRPDGPLHLIVYPTAEDVQQALIYSYDWTGGVALPRYNTSVLGIAPEQLEWAGSIIPHELSHLVIGTVVFNCQGVVLPTWLSEGLAVYAEGPLAEWRADLVTGNLEKNRLPSLRSLARGFPASSKAASLSYSQSAAVIHFLISEFGPAQVNELLASMQSGQAIDPALQQVYGFDTAGLDHLWRASLGFQMQAIDEAPAETTMRPTTVPTLALWTPVAQPTATVLPSATPAPTKPAATSTSSADQTADSPALVSSPAGDDPDTDWIWVVLGSGGGALLAIVLVLLRKENKP